MLVSLYMINSDLVRSTNDIAGFGGNQAIESAAALANSIKNLSDKSNGQRPSQEQIIASLQSYQKCREVRAAAAIEASAMLTHCQALATWGHALFVRHGLKHMGEILGNLTSDVTVGATRIDYLPLPQVTLLGTMPFNPKQGEGHKENLLVRALLATPFLVILAYAWRLLNDALCDTAGNTVRSAWFSTSSLDGTASNNRYVLLNETLAVSY
jgi:hypothetical protein